MLQEVPLGILWADIILLGPLFFLETGYELAWSLSARDYKIPLFLSSSRVTTFPRYTFLLQKGFRSFWNPSFNHLCMCAESCLTLCDPMGCSLPGSSVHGIFQARILEWVAIYCSRGYSPPRDQTQMSGISALASRFFTTAIPGKPSITLDKG